MIKYRTIQLLLIFLLASCASSSSGGGSFLTVENTILQLPEELGIKGEKLDLEIIGLLDGKCVDSLLIFRTRGANSLKVYNCNTLEYYGEIFTTGRGPDEFLNMTTNGQYESTEDGICLWVSDNMAKKICLVNLTRTLKEKSIIKEAEFKYKNMSLFNCFYINDTCIAADHFIWKNLSFSAYNPVNKTIVDYYNYFNKDLGDKDVFYLSANSAIKPDKSKIAHAMISLNQVIISSVNGPDKFSVSIGVPVSKDEIDHTSRSDRIEYFSMLTVTDSQIWLLYEGIARKDLETSSNGNKSKVIVIDWNGNPLYQFRLDRSLSTIFLNSSKNILYGIDNEENIYKYSVKSFTQSEL